MMLTCYEGLEMVARREEGDLHDIPVSPTLHSVLQEGERLLGILGIGTFPVF